MHKELNPELFGEKKALNPHGASASDMGVSNVSHLNTDRQMFEMKTQNLALAEQLNKVVGTVNDMIKNINVKFDRQQQLLARLEQSHNGLALEAGQKMGQLSQKLVERKNLDQKIQEMVDRHNNVIKSFEVRMNHLQKLLAEKESQMAACQTALNDAKMEIARLKRF